MPANVPFLDLSRATEPLLPELNEAAARVLRHGAYIDGPEVVQLERELTAYAGSGDCISCSSGTVALTMVLMALNIGVGDEVIVPAYTFAASLEPILLLGATPVLADIEPGTCLVSQESIESLVTTRTRAIIAVSLYGQTPDFVALETLASRHGLYLIEDAAQSFGASLSDRRSGSFGHAGFTSFYPTKPLAGCGDGGAVLTRDATLATRLRQIRNHGQSDKYRHVRLGINGRLDTLSCAMLLVKLANFPAHLAQRRQLADWYSSALADVLPIDALPRTIPGAISAQALYCVSLDNREAIREKMAEAGIGTAVHYPMPLHQQPAFADRCRWNDLSNAEAAARRGLCLPLFPGLTGQEQRQVIDSLRSALK